MLENMRQLRKNKGLTMKQLGETVGVAEVTISTYENGRSEPSLSILCAIADTLGCSLDMLVRGKEKGRPEGRSVETMLKYYREVPVSDLRVIRAVLTTLIEDKERQQSSGQENQ